MEMHSEGLCWKALPLLETSGHALIVSNTRIQFRFRELNRQV